MGFYRLGSHAFALADRVYPEQDKTGKRGYFVKRGSVRESWQSRNIEPRLDATGWPFTQSAQSPAASRVNSVVLLLFRALSIGSA
jgi:hypothetical protein